jgi:hypothetical protein
VEVVLGEISRDVTNRHDIRAGQGAQWL